jgi:hypothetical protein
MSPRIAMPLQHGTPRVRPARSEDFTVHSPALTHIFAEERSDFECVRTLNRCLTRNMCLPPSPVPFACPLRLSPSPVPFAWRRMVTRER